MKISPQIITLIVAVASFAVSIPPLFAQPTAERLPGLVWDSRSQWDFNPNLEYVVAPNSTDFTVGWNWGGPYTPLGERFHAPRWHIADHFNNLRDVFDPMQRVVRDSYISGMNLVPTVRRLSEPVGAGSRAQVNSMPVEACAIEYAPWLDYSSTTNDVVLLPTDESGSVFGFASRSMGQRVGTGTIQDPFRLSLVNSLNQGNQVMVLDAPTIDDAMRYKHEHRTLRDQFDIVIPDGDVSNANTEILRVAVTLRRAEIDPAGGNPNDVVLRIRLPYVLGPANGAERNEIPAPGNRPLAQYIRFGVLPPAGVPPLYRNGTLTWGVAPNLHGAVPTARISDTRNNGFVVPENDNVLDFEIRKNMLPDMVGNTADEVTIYAEFFCDRIGNLITPAENRLDAINNPRLPLINSGVPADRIDRLGIEVWYETDVDRGLSLEIRSIRIETPLATDFLFGFYDEEIRQGVNEYVTLVDEKLNTSVGTFVTPVGGNNDPITIWRFYGKDEAEPMHWASFGRVNRLLDGLVITETGTKMIDKQHASMRQTVFWQGAGFNTGNVIAGYHFQQGFDRWGQTWTPRPINQNETLDAYDRYLRIERAKWIQSYASLRFGMVNLRYPVPQNAFTVGAHLNTTFQDDPDTFLEWRPKDPLPLTLPIVGGEISVGNQPLSIPNLEAHYLDNHVDHNGGILGSLEARQRVSYANEENMLWGIDAYRPGQYIPWISNIWPQYYLRTQSGFQSQDGSNDHHWAGFANNRPKSASEMRLSYWLPLVLGAKGVMIYKGITSTEQGHSILPPDPTDQVANPRLEGGLDRFINLEAGIHVLGVVDPAFTMVNGPLTVAPFDGRTPEQLVNDEAIGRDWIEAGDNENASVYFLDRNENIPNHPTIMTTGFQETVDSLNAGNLPPLNNPRRVYVGGLTLRQITDEVTGRLAAMPQLLGRTDITGAQQNHPLTDLRLRGWFGKGFSTITRFHPDGNNPARNFDRVIDLETISQRLKTRHPRRIRDRIPGIDVPGHFDYEPYDSSFVDITVHEVVGESMDNTFVVGVLNRRTDPRMLQTGLWHQIDNTLADNERWGFVTHEMWLDSIDLNENRRFVQRGAREITLPFEYKPADGRYKMLRLQEMGGGIDTIIGQDKELAINFLPGEGKMFRVTVMPGEVVNDLKGWLSHNTQRKAVVFPSLVGGTFAQRYETVNRTRPNCANMMEATVTSFVRAREGASFRYHVVYHMRAGAQENGYLTVYYRRSEPLWFFPNDATTTDEGGIYNPEIVWEEDPIPLNQIVRSGQVITPPPSCGYPSLVVRESPNIAPLATNPLVYVVYGCEGNLPNEILICEAQLPANTSSVTQINHYGLKKSVVLSTASSDNTCALESADRLRYWGTPVVNASLNGNYYAWSDYTKGIVVGFKRPELRDFDLNQGIAELKFSDDPHVRAQYPSMHSYSKLSLGEEDCSLVWQEGPAQTCAAGTGIYYSRLHSDGIGVFPLLSPSGNLGFAAGALPTNNDQTILYVSSDPYVAAPSVNEKPTLYRNLSEFDDADMEPTNPLIAIGYQNHKAERIAWEHRHYPIGNPNYLTNNSRMIIRSSIDVSDFCPPEPNDARTVFWQSAIGRIFSVGVDLINPELIQGEQKTTFAHDTLTANAARSWMAGDTSVVLSFNSEHGYGGLPQVYHMTFAGGYHLAGDVNMELTSTQFSDAAINVSLADGLVGRRGGRVPHVSARHNITRSQSLLKNRRIFENAIGETPIQGYAPAPDVDRTAQGFFKRREQIESEADRVFRGFRSQQTSALLADIRIDGKLILLSSDRALPQEARKGVRTLYTDWFRSIELSDLELRSIPSGNSATRASAWIERRSDGEKLFLPVLNVTGANPGAKIAPSQKHEWKLLTDTKEEYRIALTCIDEDAMVAEDVEINSGMSDKLFAKTNVDQEELPTRILNLRRMEEWTVASMTSGSVQVFPMPATQEASMVITNIPAGRKRCNATISSAQGELIQSVSFDARLESSAILDFSVASLAPGMYTIKIDGTSLVGTFIVAR